MTLKFRILHLEEISSTNTLAREYADHGEPEGLVIAAEYQTAGRGKPGRKWFSPKGKNLLFSVLIRPPIAPSRAPIVTQIACRSVAKALNTRFGINSAFKRPNDLLVNGKKICGVLVEASSRSNGKLDAIIIGIGLNVNASPPEVLPEAVSIREIKGKEYNKVPILKAILAQFRRDIRELYAHSA